jgi:hypothetical protein
MCDELTVSLLTALGLSVWALVCIAAAPALAEALTTIAYWAMHGPAVAWRWARGRLRRP